MRMQDVLPRMGPVIVGPVGFSARPEYVGPLGGENLREKNSNGGIILVEMLV